MDDLNMVLSDDPSIDHAYLFQADVNKNKVAAFEAAKTAVTLQRRLSARVARRSASSPRRTATRRRSPRRSRSLKVLAPGTEDLAELQKLKK